MLPVPTTTVPAANAVPSDHVAFAGQQRFLYDAFGAERFGRWPPADYMASLPDRDPATFGEQFSRFGFVPDADDDLPVGLKRGLDDPTQVHETCALCHVGTLPDGRLWLGAPNTALDLMGFRAAVDAQWVTDGHESLLTDLEREKANAYGPGRVPAERPLSPIAVPADFPPYWLLGMRTNLNYLGTSGNLRTEVYLDVFATGVGDPTFMGGLVPFPEAARIEPMVDYMGALRPPSPPAADLDVIAMGEAIFAREHCDTCHHMAEPVRNSVTNFDYSGTAEEQIAGADPYLHGLIRTDYYHRLIVDGPLAPDGGVLDAGTERDAQAEARRQFILDNLLNVRGSSGYREPDLHGVWATAPYLHNGSVPTLDALLRPPSERPVTFMRGDFLVDTTVVANGNGGHTFGTTLSEADRAALVTYLLSN